jgi:hypothetical protein
MIATAALGLIAKLIYRPVILSNSVNDLGLAGVLPNFFWAAFLTFCFAVWMSPGRSLIASLGANVLYELDQMRPGGIEDTFLSSLGRTFDPWDIVAAIAGALASYLILKRNIIRLEKVNGV